jgi:hypothetical protein
MGAVAPALCGGLSMEDAMEMFAALDVSPKETAVCVARQDGTDVADWKVPTCRDAISDWLAARTEGLERVGMESGPLAVSL